MKSLFLFLFVSAATRLLSQTIENVDFRAVGKTISISYDFLHPKADTSINVVLVFKDQQGGSIVPKSISGDIKNVNPGEGKRILWDVLADGISLSGKYKVEISIEVFKSVRIGTQIWAAENLNVDRFRNGDPIPQAKSNEEWEKAGENQQPAWCYYDNNPANGVKYGKLYNWYAVNDPRGLAPNGWHIPNFEEWIILEDNLGGEAGKKMKSTSGWINNGNGDNTSGFNAVPGGWGGGNIYDSAGECAYWWSCSEQVTILGNDASYRSLRWNDESLNIDYIDMSHGQSVRCLKD
jgi:uncharacterized protein (TIGR02145 family)